jgi:uncharacterized membrane protein
LKAVLQIAASVLLVAYPIAVYATIKTWGPRWSALLLLALLLPLVVTRLRAWAAGKLQALGFLPLVTAALLSLGAIVDTSEFLYAVPVGINLVLLMSFAATLRWPPPMIERFARLIDPDLGEAEVRWCRLWTVIWSIFFLLNGAIAAVLAALRWIELWTLYNGLIAYLLIGTLVGIEWTMRKWRFGRFGERFYDRWLQKLKSRSAKGR